ncbi:MAG: hotdog domain-containing protein [Myxococcota bacterium]
MGASQVEIASLWVDRLRCGREPAFLALLADAAGEARGRAEGHESGVTRDLALHYLAQGKTGPLETRTRVLALRPDGALIRVEILDRGESDRLVAVATNRVCAPA